MKNIKTIFSLLLLAGASIIISCSKNEDSDTLRKEAIILSLVNDINVDSLESFVLWMENMGTRFALSENRRDIAKNIKKRFVMIGYPDTRIDSFMIDKIYKDVNYQQWQYNVIATYKGNSHTDSVCIIGAHYDNILKTGDPFSIVPGANDNASGVAAALEIARVMKKNKYMPQNTIEFIAFGAEEIGLMGSYNYSSAARQNSKNIKFVLINDMIAYFPGTNQSAWKVNIIDYDNSHNLRTEAEEMCSKYTVIDYINDNTYYKQSDSYPFFSNGYKALLFISDYIDPYYHSLNDLTVNCNFDFCKEVVKISCAILVNNN